MEKSIQYSKSRLEACSIPNCMSSLTEFSAQVPGHWIRSVFQKFRKILQKRSWKVTAAEAETTVQVRRYRSSCRRRVGDVFERFADRIIFASMFNDIATCHKRQNKCLVQGKAVAFYAARFRLGHWCYSGPGSEKTWKDNE